MPTYARAASPCVKHIDKHGILSCQDCKITKNGAQRALSRLQDYKCGVFLVIHRVLKNIVPMHGGAIKFFLKSTLKCQGKNVSGGSCARELPCPQLHNPQTPNPQTLWIQRGVFILPLEEFVGVTNSSSGKWRGVINSSSGKFH